MINLIINIVAFLVLIWSSFYFQKTDAVFSYGFTFLAGLQTMNVFISVLQYFNVGVFKRNK